MKKKLKMVGSIAVFLGIYYLATVFVGIIIGLVLVIANSTTGNLDLTKNFEYYSEKYSYVTLVLVNIVTVIFMWVLFRIRKENLFRNCNFKSINMKTIGLFVVIAVLVQLLLSILVSYVMQINEISSMVTKYTESVEPLMLGNVLSVMLVMGLIVPTFEEFLFRGVIYNELRKNLPLTVALILQSVVFAAFHGNVIQASYTFVLGLLLALIYSWYKSIWSPIVFHVAFNFSGIALNKFNVIPLLDNYRIGVIILSSLFLSIMFIPLWKNRTLNKNTNTFNINIEQLNNK